MTLDPGRWSCDDCGAVVADGELLRAPSPFDAQDEMHGCPQCKGYVFVPVCDEAGCKAPVTCGTPTVGGYRNTCHRHAPPDFM